jgi:hypothetical protein
MNARYLVAPLAAALLAAPAARAQQPSTGAAVSSAVADSATAVPSANTTESAAPTATVTSPAAGPTRDAAVAGVHRASTASTTNTEAAAPRSRGFGQAQAMIIVGGVAVLAGLIIGGGAGYAIAVGGAVVGLFGLYQYLQ